jgi:hypothetical protein
MTDTHVVSAMKAKRIQVASQIESLQRQLGLATIDLDHVEAALSLFDPGARAGHKRRGPMPGDDAADQRQSETLG